ncbi:hypothetical protein EAS61_17910 [Bradyrhizobium zhanjiangense]|uniref:Uncharacterized protein n=1 Tax=Bradyrhizobium zhanjiangense TaxID=1325107 RepID=A0A4V1KWB5_9BRAD|nr:hypothetical protein EAS61_17910 [Bradyrhizobium zhanjiangense]
MWSRGFVVYAPARGKPPACSDDRDCRPDAIRCEASIHNMGWPIAAPEQVALVRFSRLKLHVILNHLTTQWK